MSKRPEPPEIERIANEMLRVCGKNGHAARRIVSDEKAVNLRRVLVRLTRPTSMRIRTARMKDTVVVVRLDADIWADDAQTMRAKLQPPD